MISPLRHPLRHLRWETPRHRGQTGRGSRLAALLRLAGAVHSAPPTTRTTCTTFPATWCPRHGDCSCPTYDLGDTRCPLHGTLSRHAAGRPGGAS